MGRRAALGALLLAASASGFAPVKCGARLGAKSQSRRRSGRAAPVAALPAFVSAVPAVLSNIPVRAVAAAPIYYGLMSVNEYFTHRYYQHAEFNNSPWLQFLAKAVLTPFGKKVPRTRGGGHVEHHAETLDDMTLKTDARWRSTKTARSLDDDVYRGTAFTWQVTGLMTVQMLPTVIPVFRLLGYSWTHLWGSFLPAMLLHALVWNALHPNMHALPDVPIRDGAPSSWLAGLRSTWFFRFLYTNHEGHHVVGGKGNYNVACPGTDHLVGTFVKEVDWRPKCRTTYASHHGDDIDVEQQIRNHVARLKFASEAEQEDLAAAPVVAPVVAPEPVAA